MARRFLTTAELTKIKFNQSSDAVLQPGEMIYDSEHLALMFGLSANVKMELGQSTVVLVYNDTLSTIPAGRAVYGVGVQNERPSVVQSTSATSEQSSRTFGITAESIPVGGSGWVVTQGLLIGLDTSSYLSGDELWLSSTSPGVIVTTPSGSPNHDLLIGYCIVSSATDGVIYVSFSRGVDISGIHDIVLSGLASGDILRYNSANGYWENEALSALGGGATVSETPPSTPSTGDIWFNSATAETFIYYDSTWVEVGEGGGGGVVEPVQGIDFDTVAPDQPAVGRLVWDDGEGTFAFGLKGGNVNLQVGQENVALCYNGTGSTIPNGSVVYISGAQGQRPRITLAQANSEATSSKVLGITTESIDNGAEGFVATFGIVNGVDTSTFTAGQALWLSPTVAGGLTATKPVAPNHMVFVGYAISINASSGRIFVNPQNGYEIDELHDVLITSKANNDIVIYDSTAEIWKNQNIITSIGTLPVTSGGTGLSTVASGSILYGSALNTVSGLAIGTNNQVLTSNGTAPIWTANTGTGNVVRATSPTFATSVVGGATMAVFNTTSTTVNAFGAGTTINIGGTPTTAVTATILGNATATGTTKTLNLGTAGASGSTTNINIGSAVSGATTNITLNGIPTAATAAVDTNTTQLATTAYVIGQGYLKAATATSTYAPLASPALTGTPTAPTASAATNTTQIATTAYVKSQAYATLASPALTGTPTAPTAATATNTTQIATTAFVKAQGYSTTTGTVTSVGVSVPTGLSVSGTPVTTSGTIAITLTAGYEIPTTTALAAKAPLASPTFTGVPAAPTAAVDTNTTQLATTAFVIGQGYLKSAVTSLTGTANEVEVSASTGSVTIGLPNDVTIGNNLTVTGTLTVNGTTTTVNSTTLSVDDPIITLGGDTAPVADDNKDRGIEFRYYDTQARLGFMGYDDSAGTFVFLTAATNTSEVFSGTKGTIDANISGSNINAGTVSATYIDSAIARLASPTFTGTPAAPTAAVNTNTTQLATTAFVVGQAGTANPLVNGAVAVGTSLLYSRQDHVHPIDTSRAATNQTMYIGTTAVTINRASAALTLAGITLTTPNIGAATGTSLSLSSTISASGLAGSLLSSATPLINGTAAAGTSAIPSRQDHVHPTDTTRAADSAVVHLAGTETITGAKTFSTNLTMSASDILMGNTLGDRITLYGTHDSSGAYAIGIESNTMYFKSGNSFFRWYTSANADGGTSDIMELTSTGLTINGALLATTKSFDIEHPTQTDMRLRYGSLEGPENGVYVRGRSNSSTITLPDYWTGLVDEDTITIQLTPVGKHRNLYVKEISDNTVKIGGARGEFEFFYFIQAERKDVDKLVVEYDI